VRMALNRGYSQAQCFTCPAGPHDHAVHCINSSLLTTKVNMQAEAKQYETAIMSYSTNQFIDIGTSIARSVMRLGVC
jgi:hypothetical protein